MFKNKKIKTIIILILILLVISLTILYLAEEKGAVLNLLMFKGRILYPNGDANVYLNEKQIKSAKVYSISKTFDEREVDRLILCMPSDNDLKREIIIIDKNSKKVGTPNSSKTNYNMIFNYFLVQSEGSDWFVPFSDSVKGAGIRPGLIIKNNKITF